MYIVIKPNIIFLLLAIIVISNEMHSYKKVKRKKDRIDNLTSNNWTDTVG